MCVCMCVYTNKIKYMHFKVLHSMIQYCYFKHLINFLFNKRNNSEDILHIQIQADKFIFMEHYMNENFICNTLSYSYKGLLYHSKTTVTMIL